MPDEDLLAPPPRALPRAVRPFPDETVSSYLDRLARANWLDRDCVTSLMATPGRSRRENLSIVAGVPARVLAMAMPDLADGPGETALVQGRPTGPDRAACRRCAHRRSPGYPYPVVTRRHEDVLCAKHRMWLGRAGSPDQQLFLGDIYPELSVAARRHRRLIVQNGRVAILHAYSDAREVALTYAQQGLLPDRVKQRWFALRPQTGTHNLGTIWEASTYPSTVALAAIMVGMPRERAWESLAPDDVHMYRRRVAVEVTEATSLPARTTRSSGWPRQTPGKPPPTRGDRARRIHGQPPAPSGLHPDCSISTATVVADTCLFASGWMTGPVGTDASNLRQTR